MNVSLSIFLLPNSVISLKNPFVFFSRWKSKTTATNIYSCRNDPQRSEIIFLHFLLVLAWIFHVDTNARVRTHWLTDWHWHYWGGFFGVMYTDWGVGSKYHKEIQSCPRVSLTNLEFLFRRRFGEGVCFRKRQRPDTNLMMRRKKNPYKFISSNSSCSRA